jgi:hypothetical protein
MSDIALVSDKVLRTQQKGADWVMKTLPQPIYKP